MITSVKAGNISAKIIKDSISESGKRMTTLELEYPRLIHSEFMTHRMLSKNSASSRAIPIAKMIDTIRDNPGKPVHWGKNQAGMQAKEELSGDERYDVIRLWNSSMDHALESAKLMSSLGAHKQIANRITEPYQMIKVVCSGTEFSNFFWLRDHSDAQPEIAELAKAMVDCFDQSEPQILKSGEWHLPYIDSRLIDGTMTYWVDGETQVDLETAKQVSASCCAQVSYRRLDTSIEKAKDIFNRLIESEPCHASPLEHIATPMQKPELRVVNTSGVGEVINVNQPDDHLTWEYGITHFHRSLGFGSGNLYGWVQYRQTIDNNVRM